VPVVCPLCALGACFHFVHNKFRVHQWEDDVDLERDGCELNIPLYPPFVVTPLSTLIGTRTLLEGFEVNNSSL
jgi:hypothetical protein